MKLKFPQVVLNTNRYQDVTESHPQPWLPPVLVLSILTLQSKDGIPPWKIIFWLEKARDAVPVESTDAGMLGLLKPHSGKALLNVCPNWQSYFHKSLSNLSNLTSVIVNNQIMDSQIIMYLLFLEKSWNF